METLYVVLVAVAAALGALGGQLLKELLPEMALEDWKQRRQLHSVFQRYRDPIVLAATELVHRVGEIDAQYPPAFLSASVKKTVPASMTLRTTADPYFQRYKLESTVYRLCAVLGWLELYRQDVVFLNSGSQELNKRIETSLAGFREALADGHLNKAPDWWQWDDLLIFREEQRAIGEAMIVALGSQRTVLGFGEFVTTYRSRAGSAWFVVAERLLLDLGPKKDFRRDRLRHMALGLIDLIEFLDPTRVSSRVASIREQLTLPIAA